MFVKQIDMIEALRLAVVGRKINIMAPNTSGSERWANYSPDTLQNLLGGYLLFRDGPAMGNFELEHMIRDTPPIGKNKGGSRDSGVEDRSTVDSHSKQAKRVDKDRVVALREAGRNNRWIADDMGPREGTVRRVLKETKEESREKD